MQLVCYLYSPVRPTIIIALALGIPDEVRIVLKSTHLYATFTMYMEPTCHFLQIHSNSPR